MSPVSIRDFRKNLAAHLNGTVAVVIGDHWHTRGILIPLGKYERYSPPQTKKAIARAARESLKVLGELRAENRR